MFAAALVTFREALEVALIAGIILTILTKLNQEQLKKYVWYAIGSGIILSLLLAWGLELAFGSFEGRTEQIYEGILMFATAGLLTWMILWVHRQKGVVRNIEKGIKKHIDNKYPLGIFFITLTAVIREGVETVFYIRAISTVTGSVQYAGVLFGLGAGAGLGYLLYRYSIKVNTMQILKISGAILLLFAAGLVAHGVHEFQEAGLLPVFAFDPLINITHILDHGSIIGSILRTLFGYTSQPTILELFSYASYIFLIFLLEIWTDRKLSEQKAVAPKR